eukprot:768602-Hanusia_phi.AAC.4
MVCLRRLPRGGRAGGSQSPLQVQGQHPPPADQGACADSPRGLQHLSSPRQAKERARMMLPENTDASLIEAADSLIEQSGAILFQGDSVSEVSLSPPVPAAEADPVARCLRMATTSQRSVP